MHTLTQLFSRLARRWRWQRDIRTLRHQLTVDYLENARAIDSGGQVLFFTADGSIDPHFSALCITARALKDRGHSVLMTQCFGNFQRCPVYDNFGVPYAPTRPVREQTCMKCAQTMRDRYRELGLPSVFLDPFHSREIREQVRAEMKRLPENLLEYEYDGIQFGRLCAMNVALRSKIFDFSKVTPEQRNCWAEYVDTALTSYLIAQQLLQRLRPKAIVHYNDYAIYLGVKLAARQKQIPVYSLTHASHCNLDRRRLSIAPNVTGYYLERVVEAWPKWRDLPLPADTVRETVDDMLTRLLSIGSHVYSPARTAGATPIREKLGIKPESKLLVAYTSSLDEITASRCTRDAMGLHPRRAPFPAFPDQITWLRALIDWTKRTANVELAIRIHPREGRNKRDAVESQHLKALRAAFSHPIDRCRIIWPEEKISSYDLAEEATVGLVSASSMAPELVRFGLPMLAYDAENAMFPGNDFVDMPTTPESYFKKLRELLECPPSLDKIAAAFRWHHSYNLAIAIDVRDVIPSAHQTEFTSYRTPREASAIEAAVIRGEETMEAAYRRLRAMPGVTAQTERRALYSQLERVLHFLLTGEDSTERGELEYDATQVTYRFRGETIQRRQLMIRRLALLLGNQLEAGAELADNRVAAF